MFIENHWVLVPPMPATSLGFSLKVIGFWHLKCTPPPTGFPLKVICFWYPRAYHLSRIFIESHWRLAPQMHTTFMIFIENRWLLVHQCLPSPLEISLKSIGFWYPSAYHHPKFLLKVIGFWYLNAYHPPQV